MCQKVLNKDKLDEEMSGILSEPGFSGFSDFQDYEFGNLKSTINNLVLLEN